MRFICFLVIIGFLQWGFLQESEGGNNDKIKKIFLTQQELAHIGRIIYVNECGGKTRYLTHWNKGETFASLGIAHFIWYPAGESRTFTESFPALLGFLKENQVRLPLWLDNVDNNRCPWPTREAFMDSLDDYRMTSLRHLLSETIHLQSLFILKRLQAAYPKMISAAPAESKHHVMDQFLKIASSTDTLYVLVDYVNFKGEGVNLAERYNQKGWGLLQVLEAMRTDNTQQGIMMEFSRAAEMVLKRRVENVPPERMEHRWLPGWQNRINSYHSLPE